MTAPRPSLNRAATELVTPVDEAANRRETAGLAARGGSEEWEVGAPPSLHIAQTFGTTFPAVGPVPIPASGPSSREERPPHRPSDDVWTVEADHRLRNLAQLALAAGRLDRSADAASRRRCADRLAATFQQIEASGSTDDSREALPCAAALRALVEDLVTLFGPAVGAVTLDATINEMWLQTSRRRAVLLIASEWIIKALRHAFAARQSGSISVALRHESGIGSLRVGDDGSGSVGCGSGSGSRIVSTLAALARGSVRRSAMWPTGTCMELRFRVDGQAGAHDA